MDVYGVLTTIVVNTVAMIVVLVVVLGLIVLLGAFFENYGAPIGSKLVWLYGKLAWPFNYLFGSPERWGKVLLTVVQVAAVLTLPLWADSYVTAFLTFYFVWATRNSWRKFVIQYSKIKAAGDTLPKEYLVALRGVAVDTLCTPFFLIPPDPAWGIAAMLLALGFVVGAILSGPPTRRVTDDAKAFRAWLGHVFAPAGPSLAPST